MLRSIPEHSMRSEEESQVPVLTCSTTTKAVFAVGSTKRVIDSNGRDALLPNYL